MGEHWYGLALGTLATWRVTHLLQAEDGPADLIARLRRALGHGLLGSLVDCFYCLSLWIAAPFALFIGTSWAERAMLWLALSGGACLLERTRPSVAAAAYVEDEEVADDLLRQEASDVGPSPEPPAAPERSADAGARSGAGDPASVASPGPPDPSPSAPPGPGTDRL